IKFTIVKFSMYILLNMIKIIIYNNIITNNYKNHFIKKIEVIMFESKESKFVNATAKHRQWFINPDSSFRKKLEDGLSVNFKRYGFYNCPCRDTDGGKENKDIACPCRYAENDIKEWGQCFCGLYVSEEFYNNRVELGSIPERRKSV
ncbi:MAG: hypothetical protein DRI73_10060, partial [Bacteroidetes bacterium]